MVFGERRNPLPLFFPCFSFCLTASLLALKKKGNGREGDGNENKDKSGLCHAINFACVVNRDREREQGEFRLGWIGVLVRCLF